MKPKNPLLQTLTKDELIDKIINLDEKLEKLEKVIHEKDKIIKDLNERLKRQDERLKRHSQNSSKPPSADQYARQPKPQSERKKSGKKPGGQPGHKGITLQPTEEPDIIKNYGIDQCESCAHDLSNIQATHTVRQEIDIPPVKPIITEHHIASKTCPQCKKTSTVGPAHLTQAIQYGQRVKTLASYLHYDQLIPLQRIQNMFADVFSLSMSEGTIVNMHEELFRNLVTNEVATHEQLLQNHSLHFDETGVFINGKLHWLHSASANAATAYFVHHNRGAKAIDAFNILPRFTGVAVHDHWKSYFTYDQAKHSLCNAHHLRELRGIFENYHQPWAQEMRQHLLRINQSVADAKVAFQADLPKDLLEGFSQVYDAILRNALPQIPIVKSSGKRGKAKQHPAKNLHDRLTQYKTDTLRFMYDLKVPFTNNQAESDIRMTKVKQKISGGFRNINGAHRFCRIRGFISTSRKQGLNVFKSLETVARGQSSGWA
jgi:transposase